MRKTKEGYKSTNSIAKSFNQKRTDIVALLEKHNYIQFDTESKQYKLTKSGLEKGGDYQYYKDNYHWIIWRNNFVEDEIFKHFTLHLENSLFKKKTDDIISIYVLELEDNKYYIGQSKNIDKRLYQHQESKQGSEWTKKHKIVKIFEIIKTQYTNIRDALSVENEITIKYMKQFGFENVRGGDFCTLDINKLRFLLALHSDIPIFDLLPLKINAMVNQNFIPQNMLFVLKCRDNFYFIGRTNNLILAVIKEHSGLGSEITKTHQPEELIDIVDIKCHDKNEIRNFHNYWVVKYMKKFGFEKIRGGDFFNLDARNHKNKVLNYTDIFPLVPNVLIGNADDN